MCPPCCPGAVLRRQGSVPVWGLDIHACGTGLPCIAVASTGTDPPTFPPTLLPNRAAAAAAGRAAAHLATTVSPSPTTTAVSSSCGCCCCCYKSCLLVLAFKCRTPCLPCGMPNSARPACMHPCRRFSPPLCRHGRGALHRLLPRAGHRRSWGRERPGPLVRPAAPSGAGYCLVLPTA